MQSSSFQPISPDSLNQAISLLISSVQYEEKVGDAHIQCEDRRLQSSELLPIDKTLEILQAIQGAVANELARRIAVLQKHRNGLSLFYRLPAELKLDIMDYDVRGAPEPSTRAAELCTVSCLWRSLILGTPSFWESVNVSSPWWRHALLRSKNRSIDISLEVSRTEEALDLFVDEIVKHSHRWRSLRDHWCGSEKLLAVLNTPLPRLALLKIQNDPDLPFLYEGGPRLRHLELRTADVTLSGVGLSALESLIINGIIVTGRPWTILLRKGLDACHNLVELRITRLDSYADDDNTDPDQSPLSFPNLRILELASIPPDVLAAIFPIIDVVELSHLLIGSSGGLDDLDELIFPSLVDGHGRGLLSAFMNDRRIGEVRIHLGGSGMSISDKKSGLDVFLEVGDLWEKLVQVARVIPDGVLVSLDMTDWEGGDEIGAAEIELQVPGETNPGEERELRVVAAIVRRLEQDHALIPTLEELTFNYGSHPIYFYETFPVFVRLAHRLLAVRPHLIVRDASGTRHEVGDSEDE